jgi:predicted Zn-dependent peptidase
MGARRAQRNAAEAQRESDQDAQIAQLQTQQAAAATPAQQAQPSYAAELEQLAGLKQQGIITEEEFEAKKKQILGI